MLVYIQRQETYQAPMADETGIQTFVTTEPRRDHYVDRNYDQDRDILGCVEVDAVDTYDGSISKDSRQYWLVWADSKRAKFEDGYGRELFLSVKEATL